VLICYSFVTFVLFKTTPKLKVKANDSETVKFFEEKRKGHLEQYEVAMKKWEDGGGKKEKKESKVQNTFTPKGELD